MHMGTYSKQVEAISPSQTDLQFRLYLLHLALKTLVDLNLECPGGNL